MAESPNPTYLGDLIYGGIDGSISTLAIVAGVAGAGLSSKVTIILGLASLIADGFSMATSNYVSTKSDLDKSEYYQGKKRQNIKENKNSEVAKVREIYRGKGFEGKILEEITQTVIQDEQQFVKLLTASEHNIPEKIRSPFKAAWATFIAFIILGLIPVLPYLLISHHQFEIACAMTGFNFFVIGAVKGIWSIKPWWYSALETLLIGSSAAVIAFYIGYWAEGFAQGL